MPALMLAMFVVFIVIFIDFFMVIFAALYKQGKVLVLHRVKFRCNGRHVTVCSAVPAVLLKFSKNFCIMKPVMMPGIDFIDSVPSVEDAVVPDAVEGLAPVTFPPAFSLR